MAQGGVLVLDGVITAVGDAARLAPDATRHHHIDGVLLPGLVNGHTHLELADAAALAVPGPFAAWMPALEGAVAQWSEERWGRSAHRGVLQSVRAGTTAVFDTVLRGPAVPAACRAGLAGDSFVEIDDVDATTVDDVLPQVERALTLPAEGRRVGIAPTSPARLGAGVLQALSALAKRTDTPVQIHAGQAAAESAALRDGTGVFADRARAAARAFEWLDGGGRTPVRYLEALGALGERTSLVHAVHVDLGEARLLARLGVSVVCCPRVNERLRMGTAPLEVYAEARVPLALGTESLAAAPDVDVLAEAAAWVQVAQAQGLHLWPSGAGPVPLEEAAIRLATTDGARALGWGATCGALEPGRRADLVGVAVDTSAEHAYRDLVAQGAGRQILTVIGGVRKARRDSADHAWPDIDDDSWRTA
jgi:cytosine/adenosine deaminase-related metal-dependent hydrolase